MRVVSFNDPQRFSERATPLLLRREAENNFILGKLSEFAGGDAPPPGTLLLSVEGEHPVVAALMTPPHPLVITPAGPDSIDALVQFLDRAGVRPRAVSGVEATSKAFAAAWTAATGVPHDSDFGLGLFRIRAEDLLPPSRPTRGTFRSATQADEQTLVPWAEGFFREIQHFTPPHAPTVVAQRLRERRLFVWCDKRDRPVSMAGWAGRTPSGVRVNFVYTAPEHRGRGYATSCVAALTRRLLDSGRTFCFLFTDLANPTSNRIYRSIGYRHVCDFRDVRFEPGPG